MKKYKVKELKKYNSTINGWMLITILLGLLLTNCDSNETPLVPPSFIENDADTDGGNNGYVVGRSYFDTKNYIEYIPGNLPIILASPHAGRLKPSHLPDVTTHGVDNGTMELTVLLKEKIPGLTNGKMPHIIINHVHPEKLNTALGDRIEDGAGTHPEAVSSYKAFHNFIEDAKVEVENKWGAGHYFELHGNGHAEQWNEIGIGIKKSILDTYEDEDLKELVEESTVKNLCTNMGADFIEVLKGETSLGGLLQAKGWKSVPSPSYPSPEGGGFFYAGPNTWIHGSRHKGNIDATHLESYWAFMVRTENRDRYSTDVAESIITFMETHYGFQFD